jgi:hypothetical protein
MQTAGNSSKENFNINSLKLSELQKSLEQLSTVLEAEVTDNNLIDSLNLKITEILKTENLFSPNHSYSSQMNLNFVKNFFESVSSWILKSFNSVKLTTIVNLVSSILDSLNYKAYIRQEEITKILQLETYESILKNAKKEKKNYEEILSPESFLTNQFLSAFFALVATISNKPEIILKSKNLLRSVLTVMTQICGIDNVAVYYKKKRLISNFSKILKELKLSYKQDSNSSQDSFVAVSKLLMILFAKIGNKRPVYRDYMFKKAVPDKITDIFTLLHSKDPEIVKTFCTYCFFAVRTVDHKTYFWTKGVINVLIDYLNKILLENPDEEIIEFITLCIYNLSFDNYDVQLELKDLNYLDTAKNILMKFSKNNFLIFNVLSTLRRIKDEEFVQKITEELLFTYFALFDYFYLTVKKEIEGEKKRSGESFFKLENMNRFEFIILKELVAILGNIVKEEIHSKPFIDKNLHLVLIDLKLTFIEYPKIIKNTIGALINLTTSNEIRENISKVAAFVQSIYIVLDKYKDNQAIIDYELKLIINVMKNDITVKTFISSDMFFYLLLFLKNYVSHDEIIFNSVKIIRTLILKSKLLKFSFYQQNFLKTYLFLI